jgi:hypothetical protein
MPDELHFIGERGRMKWEGIKDVKEEKRDVGK